MNINIPESEALETCASTRTLASGRVVILKTGTDREELEVRAPDGQVEVHILLTEAGPVVRLTAARLELDSTDTVAVHCRRFEVQASEEALLEGGDVQISGRELRVRTQEDIHMNADFIRLNCDDPPLAGS